MGEWGGTRRPPLRPLSPQELCAPPSGAAAAAVGDRALRTGNAGAGAAAPPRGAPRAARRRGVLPARPGRWHAARPAATVPIVCCPAQRGDWRDEEHSRGSRRITQLGPVQRQRDSANRYASSCSKQTLGRIYGMSFLCTCRHWWDCGRPDGPRATKCRPEAPEGVAVQGPAPHRAATAPTTPHRLDGTATTGPAQTAPSHETCLWRGACCADGADADGAPV